MENTPHNRLQLLQFTERSQWRGFQLNLNGEAVTAQDQVDGMQLALIARRLPDALSIDPSASTKEEHEFLYHMYLALVLDNMGVSGFEAKLCISGKGLKYFGDLVCYHLNISAHFQPFTESARPALRTSCCAGLV